MIEPIQMLDLKRQYLRNKHAIDQAIQQCVNESLFINGPQIAQFENKLAHYLQVDQVITCANGTDALQLALMALDLKPGDEVIVPAFTYAATIEVIALLGLSPVIVDVDPFTFTLSVQEVEAALSEKTRAVVPVHLFGQCADMEEMLQLCQSKELYLIEDNAQAIGAHLKFRNGQVKAAGTIGHIGTTSFFPSKNLGCFGDGGSVFTNDAQLGDRIRKIANHGQVQKYKHDYIGINSRLDTLQAAILSEKLKLLDDYNASRKWAAAQYDQALAIIPEIEIPRRAPYSTHVFHQYTIQVPAGERDELQAFLRRNQIPTMIYYPISLARQKAYQGIARVVGDLSTTERLCQRVLSLPMHTELSQAQLDYIGEKIAAYFAKSISY